MLVGVERTAARSQSLYSGGKKEEEKEEEDSALLKKLSAGCTCVVARLGCLLVGRGSDLGCLRIRSIVFIKQS